MGNTPFISVIMPVYNSEEYLDTSIQSVLNQSFRDLELILVNDCSRDKSKTICQKYAEDDERVKFIDLQENIGAGKARNKGLECAVGKYVAFWDADDRFHPKALEELYHKSEQVQADICVCEVCEFRGDGKLYETGGYLQKINCRRKIHLINMTYRGISLALHRTCCGIKCFAERSLWKMRLHSRISGREMM